MSAQIQIAVTLTEVNCGECGGVYALNERYRAQCESKGTSWHCPYCQVGWGYTGRGRVQVLEKELAAERERKAAALARANEAEQNLAQALKKQRAEHARLANGTCPCCKRTFKQLARHMANKHPEFAK